MLIALLITSDLTVTMMVIAVLLILFTGFVTELWRKNEFFDLLGALALVLSFVLKQPVILFTFPMITYAFASFKEHIFREEKRAGLCVPALISCVFYTERSLFCTVLCKNNVLLVFLSQKRTFFVTVIRRQSPYLSTSS